MGKVEQRPTFIEDLYQSKTRSADNVLQKIKNIVRTMTIMEIKEETDNVKYKNLKALLKRKEEELFEFWF